MSHDHRHRGAHPEDRQLFTPAAISVLRVACEECTWLLDRGYAVNSVLDVVSRRHQLHTRQRLALQRSMGSSRATARRVERELEADAVRSRVLVIDGFNLIISLEVALSGGLLLRGTDGAIRDLAGLRGTYRPVAETSGALRLLGEMFEVLQIAGAHVYLDSPVSNSGRLKSFIGRAAAHWSTPVDTTLVANPDRQMKGLENVVSSDSAVIDEAVSWFNLTSYIVTARLPDAWLVDMRLRQ